MQCEHGIGCCRNDMTSETLPKLGGQSPWTVGAASCCWQSGAQQALVDKRNVVAAAQGDFEFDHDFGTQERVVNIGTFDLAVFVGPIARRKWCALKLRQGKRAIVAKRIDDRRAARPREIVELRTRPIEIAGVI